MSSLDDKIVLRAKVEDVTHGSFRVKCDDNGHFALCILSGKLRTNKIRVLAGDSVTVELSAYDVSRGRITYRH